MITPVRGLAEPPGFSTRGGSSVDTLYRPWLVIATKARGNRPGVSMSWLTRRCRTRAEGRAICAWLRARGWFAGVEVCRKR